MWMLSIGEWGVHKYSSLALVVLVAWHLKLHWRMYVVHGRNLFSRLVHALARLFQRKPKLVKETWDIAITGQVTKDELEEFAKIKAFFEEHGSGLHEITTEHIKGINLGKQK